MDAEQARKHEEQAREKSEKARTQAEEAREQAEEARKHAEEEKIIDRVAGRSVEKELEELSYNRRCVVCFDQVFSKACLFEVFSKASNFIFSYYHFLRCLETPWPILVYVGGKI